MRLLYDSVLDDCTIIGSERSGFPMTNVQHPHLVKRWRSLDLSVPSLLFDAGTGNKFALDTLVLAAHNLTAGATIKLQGNDTDDWSAPPLDDTVTYAAGIIIHYLAATASYRFIKITFTDASNPDDYIEIGRVMGVLKVTVAGVLQEGIVEDIEDSTTLTESVTKQVYSDVGVVARVYELPFEHISSTTRAQLKAFYAAVGAHIPIVLVPNENDVTTFPPIYCQFSGKINFEHAGVSYFKPGSLRFVEVF